MLLVVIFDLKDRCHPETRIVGNYSHKEQQRKCQRVVTPCEWVTVYLHI